MRITLLAAAAAVAAAPAILMADVANLGASKDNTLFFDPNGELSSGAGPNLFAGKTLRGGDIRRGLIAFDTAAIPAGATINSVELRLFMDMTISGSVPVSLHSVTSNWGEGTSSAGGGTGTQATTNDATWIHTFYTNAFWTTPGGDFDSTASATTSVDQVGFYSWSSPAMVADVQNWLDNGGNFGWLIMGDESANGTAKRFVSREGGTPENLPVLVVDYTPIPAPAGMLAFAGLPLLMRRRRCAGRSRPAPAQSHKNRSGWTIQNRLAAVVFVM